MSSSPIKRLIVLMLENRSFDHMLGYCRIPGVDGVWDKQLSNKDRDGHDVPVSADAKGVGDLNDPGHDFVDVNTQLFFDPATASLGSQQAMQGFVVSYAKFSDEAHNVMRCYTPRDLPVLHYLAANFGVCDRWFASIPGPTLCNRLFAHAGSSDGRLDQSADYLTVKNTIYQVLDAANVPATIYADGWSSVTTVPGLLQYEDQFFATLDDFHQDCADGNLPRYCFLEPRYSSGIVDGTYRPQNDQHPDSDINEGEHLIYSVYKAIRANRKIWSESMLVITYDEHGGLYDHVSPPAALQPYPEDVSPNPPFKFDRLGVRVPAVIVSAYTNPMVSHETYDHTSLIATARKLLTNAPPDDVLGQRAMHANTLDVFINRSDPRNEHHEFAPNPLVAKPRDTRPMNHLQVDHLRQAHLINAKLPSGVQIKPKAAWSACLAGSDYSSCSHINKEDAEHYVRNVYKAYRDVKGSSARKL